MSFHPKIPEIFQRKTGNKHNLLDLGNCRGLNVWSVTCVFLLLCADGLTHTPAPAVHLKRKDRLLAELSQKRMICSCISGYFIQLELFLVVRALVLTFLAEPAEICPGVRADPRCLLHAETEGKRMVGES